MLKRKKIFYMPGIISLIGIWLFYFHFQKRFIPKKETCLYMAFPKDGNDPYKYTTSAILRSISNKKKIRFELDDDQETNQKKMELIRYEARKLKYTEDTTAIIWVSLSEYINYGNFVELLNLCYADDHRRFALIRNVFMIYPGRKNIPAHYIRTTSLAL